MKYRRLGKTDLMVSEIGLGCSGFWGDKHFSDEKAINVVLEAFKSGVNFFDTGSNYSNFNAEPRLGRAIREILKTNSREKLVISTKAGSTVGYAPKIEDNDLSHADFSAAAIEKSCQKSIANLNCGYVDILQLHGFCEEMLNDELFACLRSLKQRGLIRYVGVNTHFRDDLLKIIEHKHIFDMVLIDCNLLQLDRFEIIDKLHHAGIGVVVGTVLAQGHLISKKIGSFSNGSFFWYLARTLIKPTTKEFSNSSADMRKTLRAITEMTPAQAAFAYLLENENIASCLFGTTSTRNLIDVLSASGKTLHPDSKRNIEATYAKMASLSR